MSTIDDRPPPLGGPEDDPMARLGRELVAAAARRFPAADAASDGSTVGEPAAGEPAADEPAADEPAADELVILDDRRARRRSRNRRLLVAAAVAVVVAAGAVAVPALRGTSKTVADVKVTRNGSNRVTVLLSRTVSVGQLSAALEASGVEVKVEAQATGPSLVNRFVSIAGPPDAVLVDAADGSSTRATFTAGSDVTLLLGVPAEPGRPYDVPTDATAPHEPLAGLAVIGQPVGRVEGTIERAAAAHHLTVEYRPSGRPGPRPAADDPRTVFLVQMLSSSRVAVFVNP